MLTEYKIILGFFWGAHLGQDFGGTGTLYGTLLIE